MCVRVVWNMKEINIPAVLFSADVRRALDFDGAVSHNFTRIKVLNINAIRQSTHKTNFIWDIMTPFDYLRFRKP